ncbi:Golgi Transport [Cichlidogyrus casuarinus]|uniref:Aspartate aminotransferase n=1 Tax=Cichlidogyrus casuarinus TaxID=1844966 RepID=A0ABD2Q9Z9_9PLAT
MTSIFSDVKQAPGIEVFALVEAFKKDAFDKKVNLAIGAYRDDDGKPWVLPVVNEVEKSMAEDATLNHEYLPITGLESFCLASIKLLLGDDHPKIANGHADGIQALGGTGCIFLGLQFLSCIMGFKHLYISKPTWPNHRGIGQQLGMEIHEYTYWDKESRCVNFAAMKNELEAAPENAVIMLHACAHNPTGMDLTHEQWTELATVMKSKKLFPFFDIAYQGFGSGSLEQDGWSVNFFISQGFETFIAQSFSKNFGLYNERVGNLAVVTNDAKATEQVKSQIKLLVRKSWSNPPQHGARIVSSILNNPALKSNWMGSVSKMAERIKLMRSELHQRLLALKTPGNWDHVIKQIGMFSYTGLTESQVRFMKEQYHIYLLSDGRINMCGLNTHNLDYVAKAIHEAVTGGL